VSTQLRLVEPPEPTSAAGSGGGRPSAARRRAGPPSSGRSARGTGRRPAHWGEWHLDTRTRRVGRAGVAAARAALEQAAAEQQQERASQDGHGRRMAS
jgi:hypothetical protein